MILPDGFETLPGFSIENSAIHFNKINGMDRISFLIYSKTEPVDVKNVTLSFPDSHEGSEVMTKLLGMDESMRKLIAEITPKGIKAVAIMNPTTGVFIILQRPPGGSTGNDGLIRTIEYVYSYIAPDSLSGKLVIIPVVYEEDFDLYPREVVEAVNEFNNLLLKEIKIINNKRFKQLFETYESVRNKLEIMGSNIETMNRSFFDDLKESNVDGIATSELPLLKMLSTLQAVAYELDHVTDS
jgi:uncharacterized protein YdcH (DUF465 family)